MRKEKSKKKPSKDQRKLNPPPKKQIQAGKFSVLLGLGFILLLGILIYSNSFGCSFHFDDGPNIIDNPAIRNISDMRAWWSTSRPVAILSFALNYHYYEFDVWYWHLVNLIIHLANSCLVYMLTWLILSTPVFEDHPVIQHKRAIAFFTALLFVSHPLATQSVTYMVQRMTSLAAFFYLLSLILYLKGRLIHNNHISKFLLLTGALISALLAILTKENAFTLPFAILLFEIFFLQTRKRSINFKDYRTILFMATFFSVMMILPLKYSFNIFNPILPVHGNTFIITPLNYLFTQFSVILKYIQLLILPVHQNLDYDFPVSNHFFELRTMVSFLVLVSLIALAIYLFRKNRLLSFGIFWFFLTLSVESSFIPIEDLIFEHRVYLPSFGFFLMVSSGIFGIWGNTSKPWVMAILAFLAGSYTLMSYQRNKVWKDDLTLWSDVVAKSPDKARAYTNRGIAYGELGQWDKAISDYSMAIERNPEYLNPYNNRGFAYGKLGQWDKAIADLSKAIRIDPNSVQAYNNLGNAYSNLGNWERALAHFSKVIEIDPKNAEAYNNHGIVNSHLGQWDKAIIDFSSAIEIEPKYTSAYSNRGIAYGELGHWEQALADYAQAIALNPRFVKVYFDRGVANGYLAHWSEAITDYSKVIEIDPQFLNVYNNRGRAYAELGQLDKAIADFSRALEIDPKNTNAFSNREMAYQQLKNTKK